MSLLKASVLLVALLPCKVLAGVHVGNGGDVVVCYEDAAQTKISTVELLDHYEAVAILRGMTPSLGTSADFHDGIRLMVERIKRHDYGAALNIQVHLDDFLTNASFIGNGQFVDISDSLHVVVPEKCRIRQIAIQRDPRWPEEPRYLVDENLFLKLTPQSKAMLAMHEALYRIASMHGQVNSLNVRYLTAYLASERPEVDSAETFRSVLRSAGATSEFWFDEEKNTYWGLFEGRTSSPDFCGELAGNFNAPSLRELRDHVPRLLSSPLERFLFLLGNESLTLWTRDFESANRPECPGIGINSLKTLTIDGDVQTVGHHCAGVAGPILLCLER